MTNFGKNFYIKNFKDEDYNVRDIIMIYNEKIRNDENYEILPDKVGLFESNIIERELNKAETGLQRDGIYH